MPIARFAILADPRLPDALAETRTVVEPAQSSVYVVNADGTGGKWWCPSLTFIADSGLSGTAIAWSPDSASLAVLSQIPKIGYRDIHSYLDVCTASGARRVATIDNAGANVAWTGNGRDLAFLSSSTDVMTPDHLWTVPAADGKPADRTPNLEDSVTGLFPIRTASCG